MSNEYVLPTFIPFQNEILFFKFVGEIDMVSYVQFLPLEYIGNAVLQCIGNIYLHNHVF